MSPKLNILDMEANQRLQIPMLLDAGQTPAQIKCQLGKSYLTIHHLWQHQLTERSPRDPVRTKRIPELATAVAQEVEANPHQMIRQLARDHGISHPTMPQELLDQGLSSYTRPRRHAISAGAEVCRLERVREILGTLQHQDQNKTILFSNEKFFTLASYSNRCNDQIWCQGELNTAPDDLRHVQVRQREPGAAWRNLGTDFVRRCTNGFIPRLRRVVTAKGGRIEWEICQSDDKSLLYKSYFIKI